VSADEQLEHGQALDLAAAELRADSVDIEALVSALAARLEDALPRMVTVKRRKVGGFRSKETEVEAIALSVGDTRASSSVRTPGGFDCTRHAVVRGITLKREQQQLREWIDEVVEAVTHQAQVSEQARIGLEGLVR
jgi:hypothetical protein